MRRSETAGLNLQDYGEKVEILGFACYNSRKFY